MRADIIYNHEWYYDVALLGKMRLGAVAVSLNAIKICD